jgi:hypothetical protein
MVTYLDVLNTFLEKGYNKMVKSRTLTGDDLTIEDEIYMLDEDSIEAKEKVVWQKVENSHLQRTFVYIRSISESGRIEEPIAIIEIE